MNRCTKTMLSLLVAGVLSAVLYTPNVTAQPLEDAKSALRPFPKLAKRGELVIRLPPEVLLDGKLDRLSPGARIRNAANQLVLSGTLVDQKLPIRYLRDNLGLLHEIWVLNAEEARQKMPGEDSGGLWNNIRSLFDTPPASDDGKTPYDQLPSYK